jgi:hypothetical protein
MYSSYVESGMSRGLRFYSLYSSIHYLFEILLYFANTEGAYDGPAFPCLVKPNVSLLANHGQYL